MSRLPNSLHSPCPVTACPPWRAATLTDRGELPITDNRAAGAQRSSFSAFGNLALTSILCLRTVARLTTLRPEVPPPPCLHRADESDRSDTNDSERSRL